jgi:hypothetical protein
MQMNRFYQMLNPNFAYEQPLSMQQIAMLSQALQPQQQEPQQVMQSGLLSPGITQLPAEEEQQFQSWIRGTDWYKEFVKEFGEEPELDIPEYDYRAAWKAGITPERDPYDQNRYHWPSSLPSGEMLKSESHPTAWKEMFMRQTGQNPDALGIKTKEEADAILRGLR